MNGAELSTELLSNTSTTTANYSDTNRWIDLNKSYHFIEDLLTQEIGENYFYQEFTATTVVGQKEYTFPENISGNLDGLNKSIGVSIDYGNGYVKATKTDVQSLDRDISWYVNNQSTSEPLYTIQDNSIMIFPAPTVAGTYKLYGIQNLIDITSSTTEANIFNGKVPKKYHYLIALGAEQYCYIRRKLTNEAQEAETRFLGKLLGEYVNGKYIPGMLDILNTRGRGARIRQMPTGYKVF